MKLHLAWVLVDRVHCTFGNCAKVREKTFDPGVAEEKRSAWVRSFDSDALLRYCATECQYSASNRATECHGCSAERLKFRNQMRSLHVFNIFYSNITYN